MTLAITEIIKSKIIMSPPLQTGGTITNALYQILISLTI